MEIRDETAADHIAICDITRAAFADKPYSDQTEAEVIEGLRAADAIRLSLVAVSADEVVGNVVFSDVAIDGVAGWVGLGPVSVKPALQRGGIGSVLIKAGLDRIRATGAAGCVLVGDPGYYGRFGFKTVPGLGYGGVPDDYVMALAFGGALPRGTIVFHPAFGAA
ncbi:MAG: N-acetyltransferase [Rhizobium sp.]|nr:N-acetyltransferase [Rhizobium sp.]